MASIIAINAQSPHLETVKALGRANKATLGYLPDGAFDDHAADGHVLAALDDSNCVGYVLYRIVRDRAAITHFCIATEARGRRIARTMLDHLIERTKKHRGIILSCRRDFDANKLWPHLGFHWLATIRGRAKKGSELDRWSLDYFKPDLFRETDQSTALDAAIDANIFLDLVDRKHDETEWLRADWLQPFVTLCYTGELLNDLGQHGDAETRRRRVAEAQEYKRLEYSPDAYVKSENLLRPLFPNLTSERDKSDFRHLVRAHAAEANVFVTRDGPLLDRADDVLAACGLRIVRPAELIGSIDVLVHEREYQRDFVAGTREVFQERISCSDDALLDAIKAHDEPRHKLEAAMNAHLAAAEHTACYKIAENDGTILATYVVESIDGVARVPLLRVCAKRQAGTLARAVLTGIIRKAVKEGSSAVFITEGELPEHLQTASTDLGFLPVAGGRVKLIVRGWITTEEAVAQLTWADPRIDELRDALPEARTDASKASKLEHLIWPAKLSDADLPCYIVPIRPEFAEQLFDEGLARSGLFGADVALALNPESAYYRAARPGVLCSPARVLWYVSDKGTVAGAKTIRACSRIVELECGTPKRLFSRFRRLGVYEWKHVLATADGQHDKEIMAFRFDDTELLPRPIGWQRFQAILAANGKSNPLQGPVEIPSHVFGQIYAAALDTPAVR
jgi:ribosomal protein S18 acetylase RimI-like enzyme/predicted nucleic acid-binding protein